MRKILRATENYARRLSRLTGLTASQLLLLQVLDQHGETTAGQIAAHMGITQATTTSLLHKLEDRGMVRRQRGDSDRDRKSGVKGKRVSERVRLRGSRRIQITTITHIHTSTTLSPHIIR